MPTEFALAIDLTNVYRTPDGRSEMDLVTTVAWDDRVDVDKAGSTAEVLKARIDGERLLVYTRSGQKEPKEPTPSAWTRPPHPAPPIASAPSPSSRR